MDPIRRCVICGGEFYAIKRDQKYCSQTCRSRKFRATTLAERKENRTVTRVCKNCGKEFRTSDWRKKCCTPECNWRLQNSRRKTTKRIKRICPVCSTEFMAMQKRGVGRTYCTKKCKSKANRERNKSHQSERMWEYRKKRKLDGNWWKALNRDKFTCQICGNKKYPSQWTKRGKNKLVIHHLDGTGEKSSKNHSLDNLMTLCDPCHKLFHAKINLVLHNGKFVVSGDIFKILGITAVNAIST